VKTLYCWRCRMEMPMLDSQEFDWLDDAASLYSPKNLHNLRRAPTTEFWEKPDNPHCVAYYHLTGVAETNPKAIGHHSISLYGPPCAGCGVPLRTPRAKRCAACGEWVR